MDLFKPIELDYKEKYYNLDIESKGEVKSTKYFPVFLIDGEEYIFKPLSKTKPLTTPLFAFSEVFWSYIINKYFDSRTPIYRLIYCKGVSNDQPKYYDKGVLVKSVLKANQKLINIYEYFEKYPEDNVNISSYVNYCMKKYDYTHMLESKFCIYNNKLGEGLAFQILLSILRQDQNFHYENVNYTSENDSVIEITAPLDFEFSTMFLYPDSLALNEYYKTQYLQTPEPISFTDPITNIKYENIFFPSSFNTVIKNIIKIVETYPDIVEDFILMLDKFRTELDAIEIHDKYNYIDSCNSESWQIGHARYKENNEELAKQNEEKYKPIDLDKAMLFKKIKDDTKEHADRLSHILKVYLYCYRTTSPDFENIPFSELEEFYNNKGIGQSLKKKQ